MKEQNRGRGWLLLIAVLGVLCILCGVFLLRGAPGPRAETPVVSEGVPDTPTPSRPEPEDTAQPQASEQPYVSPIDFETLQAGNPDIYGWLRIPGTAVDYPLVQRSGDDGFYLNHDSEGNYSPAGAIFTESAYNAADMEDPVTLVYGHQMYSGTMFGSLQPTYSQPDNLETCGEIVVYLPDREYHYQVFAAVPYDDRHILYHYDFSDPRRYNAFLNSVFSVRSIGATFREDLAAAVTPEDRLLILSTCLTGNDNGRYLVLAKRQSET